MGCLLSIATVTDIRQQSKCYRNTHTWPEAVCQPINRGHYFSILFDCLQIKMSWMHSAKKHNAHSDMRERKAAAVPATAPPPGTPSQEGCGPCTSSPAHSTQGPACRCQAVRLVPLVSIPVPAGGGSLRWPKHLGWWAELCTWDAQACRLTTRNVPRLGGGVSCFPTCSQHLQSLLFCQRLLGFEEEKGIF